MRDDKPYESGSPDDESNRPLTDDELLYLNAGYVHFDGEIQSNSEWGISADSKKRD